MLTAYTDGGARGNPGPAGYGVQVVDDNGEVVAELYAPLGHATNNVAEYEGLIAALDWASSQKLTTLRVRMDSELIVKQMLGLYKVKHAGLQPLHARARALVQRVGRVIFEHVRREQNREADRLSNLGMDIAQGVTPGPTESSSAPESATPPSSTAATPAPARTARAAAPPRGSAQAVGLDFGDPDA